MQIAMNQCLGAGHEGPLQPAHLAQYILIRTQRRDARWVDQRVVAVVRRVGQIRLGEDHILGQLAQLGVGEMDDCLLFGGAVEI
jgi:hypothetical protein